MKRIFVTLSAAAMLIPCAANAGEIFGTLKAAGKPVGAGVKLEVKAGDHTYAAQTDASGGYRLYVEEEGKFPLVVYYQNKTASFNVVSFDGSARYDLSLEQAGGNYVLKRQ